MSDISFDYKTIAETAYRNIKARFDSTQYTDSYWDLGNVFDTMTDYLAFAREQSDPEFAGLAYKKYLALVGSPNSPGQDAGCWYDDFAWWGIASAKAYDKTFDSIFGNWQKNFQDIALYCWKTMKDGKSNPEWSYKGAPNVWDNRDNGHPDEDYWNKKENWATPRFGNGVGSGLQGVWQYDIFRVERSQNECSPGASNPADPKSCNLGPFQDTVVNGLFLVLALRLLKANSSSLPTRQSAKDEYGFLNAWFDDRLGSDSLLLRFSDNTMLVRERVTTYAEIDNEFPPIGQWNESPDTCWAGDQGLIIGGLTDSDKWLFSTPNNYKVITSVILGVANHMSQNGVIQYHYDELGDPGDYKCGVGVFMRYLLYTFIQNPTPVRQTIAQIKNVLLTTTNNMCENASPYDDLFDNFNILSTLTTAKALGIVRF